MDSVNRTTGKEGLMDDKWFFYLTLFLVLFVASTSSGLVQNRPLFKMPPLISVFHSTLGLVQPQGEGSFAVLNGGR
jgi:hypothetical protein